MAPKNSSKGILAEIVDFFASVKVALVLLITLAITSVLGTILPQGEAMAFYRQNYNPIVGKLIRFFQLYDMYHSWWFQWLLLLLAVNLIVCSIQRFSTTWRVISAPSRAVSDHLFESLPFRREFSFKEHSFDAPDWVRSLLGRQFGKLVSLSSSQGTAFYLEKGRFSRFGVYLIHLSILVIFLGAMMGSLYGFKGFLDLKEGESKDRIFIRGHHTLKELGFSVRLDRFAVAFYPGGVPREYRSDLSIWEAGKEKEKATIRVNDPFTYKGITFYQSSWDRFPTFIKLSLKKDGRESELRIEMDQRTAVPETPFALEAVRYVNNLSDLGPALGVILLKDEEEVDHAWILTDHPEFHGNRLEEFQVKVKEFKTQYITGLQVNRDPGIWFVWIGSSMMLIGFIIAFYFSHQQVWIWIQGKKDSNGGEKIDIMIGGTAHKNREAFVRKMELLTEKFRK